MSTRYILKIVDFGLQVLCVLIPFVSGVATGMWYYMVLTFPSLGTTQFLSCIVNRFFLSSKYRSSKRIIYETILISYTIVALLLFVFSLCIPYIHLTDYEWRMQNINRAFMYILLITSPFLGIGYGIISFVEIGNVKYNKEG